MTECAYCHRPNPQHITFDDDPICDDCSEPASARFERCPEHQYLFQDGCDTCFVWKEALTDHTRPYEERDDWLENPAAVERPDTSASDHAWAHFVQLGGTSREAFNAALDTYTAHLKGEHA